ncbi:acetolactate synthase [Cellulomonas sp. NTE-D12]|nr:acetolactate synthase [Cellulomonas sp. NTE-D12]
MSVSDTDERLTVAAYLAKALPELGVSHVFELVGGMLTVMLDSIHRNPALTVVSMHHEQGAGFAAEGFARTSGRPAVAMATSGPGATNLLTAIGSCYFDSVPVVFITGQVNTYELHEEGRGRQGGFQETDVVSIATPITKLARLVTDADSFPKVLAEAFEVATRGRPGPVLLDIPMNVQRALVPAVPDEVVARSAASDDRQEERGAFTTRLTAALRDAKRPLVIAGGGVQSAGVAEELRTAVERWRIPVVGTLMGVDALPATSELHAGVIGSYGNRWANWAVAQSDLLLVLGSRLDVRQTGSDVAGFRGSRAIFHVDVDATELNNHVTGCDVLHDDLRTFLPFALDAVTTTGGRAEWLAALAEQREAWPDTAENVPAAGLNPNLAVRQILQARPAAAAVVTDVGQHQMWAAQSAALSAGQRFLTSGGMGSMGFGLPAAIGSALASQGEVVLIAGDGGFQCNIQELQTLVRQQLPVRVVVFDNGCHGMVRQFQESYFDKRYYSTKWGYSAPDFCAVARAYGIPAFHAEDHDQLAEVLDALHSQDGPVLLHLSIDADLNAYPKMAFGREFGSMEPGVKPTEMEGT